jgi:ElaB/YqjD/DUF883 family membrane-anchored ribosome-binding protein
MPHSPVLTLESTVVALINFIDWNGTTMEMNIASTETRSKLADDLKALILDAEELLKSTSDQADSRFQSAKARFSSTLQSAKSSLADTQDSLIARTKDAAAATDKYVQENPWRSVGAVALAGLLIGLLVGRK